jgi:hypothetical protein
MIGKEKQKAKQDRPNPNPLMNGDHSMREFCLVYEYPFDILMEDARLENDQAWSQSEGRYLAMDIDTAIYYCIWGKFEQKMCFFSDLHLLLVHSLPLSADLVEILWLYLFCPKKKYIVVLENFLDTFMDPRRSCHLACIQFHKMKEWEQKIQTYLQSHKYGW